MDHNAKKEALKPTTLAQSPKVVKLTVKGVPRQGIPGVAYQPFNAAHEAAKMERDKRNEAQFGFDPTATRGTGFPLLKKVSRVRLSALTTDLLLKGYVRSSSKITQRFTGNGKLTASLDIVFYKEGNVGEPVQNAAVATFLSEAYVDQVDVYANPTLEGSRVDSIVCVLGQPPKDTSVETGDPGQHIQFDGLGYKVIDLQPEDEDVAGVSYRNSATAWDAFEAHVSLDYERHEDEESRRMSKEEVPNPFYTDAGSGGETVATNRGDKLREADATK